MRDDLPARALVALILTAGALLAPPGAADASAQARKIVASPTLVSLPDPGPADFDFAYVQYQGTVQLSIDVPASGAWSVFVRCEDADLGGGKPVEDLLYRLDGASAWIPASALEQLFTTGNGDSTVQVEIGVALDWAADPPADHTGSLRFRVTN
jgi:hypothetical protein